ncbi:MAG: hypothetical protein QOD01_2775 [Actinomycetota bacterium]|jgi:hypothetical protein|nr:hypothetical protein [Actinomycetota bacterium]
MDHVIDLTDAETFQRCRRAWDFGASARQNLEPVEPLRPVDVGRAVRDGLAAWYFPAMRGWDRSLVRPIAMEAFHKSMRAQQGDASATERGALALSRYFDWAPGVDDFSPVRVTTEFNVVVPHAAQAGAGLVAADGRAVRFRGRFELVVVDEHHRLWLVEHRIVDGEWADLDTLVLDHRSACLCWALESQYDAPVAGVMINELRLAPGPPAPAASMAFTAGPRRRGVTVVGDPDGWFRRARIRKAPKEVRRLRRQFAAAALEMCDPAVPIYPNPAPEHCGPCAFVAPCLAMSAGEDPAPLLEASFRHPVPEVIELPPRTGSCGPQRVYGWKTKGPGVKQNY